MVANIVSVLEHCGVPVRNVVHVNYWPMISMRDLGNGSVTRVLPTIMGEYALTAFPPTNVRTPGALVEGALIAVIDAQQKEVAVDVDSLTLASVAAVRGGSLLFTSGEVPLDRRARRLIDKPEMLATSRSGIAFGRSFRATGSAIKAAHIYSLLQELLTRHGCSLRDVVRQDVYLVDVSTFGFVERVSLDFYDFVPPPTTIIPVRDASPFPDAQMEIEVTCFIQPQLTDAV
jgi:enamine deaminase RidA (YjgF/YER057c/UK114 family)